MTLPDLPAPYNTITPNKLSYSIDEAKEYAAEYVLGQLGIRLEMPSDLPQLATPVYMAAPTGGLGPAYPAFGTLLPPGSFPPHRQRPPPGASPSSSSPKSLSPHRKRFSVLVCMPCLDACFCWVGRGGVCCALCSCFYRATGPTAYLYKTPKLNYRHARNSRAHAQ